VFSKLFVSSFDCFEAFETPHTYPIIATCLEQIWHAPARLSLFFLTRTAMLIRRFPQAACQHSPVLKAAFNSKFIEGETQTYRLKDTTEKPFRYLVQWFYAQRINFSIRLDDSLVSLTPGDTAGAVKELTELILYWRIEHRTLFRLWILADKLLIPAVQNIVMDKLGVMHTVDKLFAVSFVFSVEYVYQNTGGDSPLRQFLVEYLAWHLGPLEYSKLSSCFPKDFLVSLAIAYSTQLPEKARVTRQNAFDIAKFHVTRDVGE
jgi:hypothetical protein